MSESLGLHGGKAKHYLGRSTEMLGRTQDCSKCDALARVYTGLPLAVRSQECHALSSGCTSNCPTVVSCLVLISMVGVITCLGYCEYTISSIGQALNNTAIEFTYSLHYTEAKTIQMLLSNFIDWRFWLTDSLRRGRAICTY